MSIHATIRSHRLRLGMTEQQFADRAGVTRAAVQQWEREGGTAPRRSKQADVANVLGISLAELLGVADTTAQSVASEGAMQAITGSAPAAIDLDNNPDYPAIRRVRFRLSAGASGFGVDYSHSEDGAPIVFQRGWYEARGLKPCQLFAVKVANGSMEPGLHDGDTVVVNTDSVTPKDGVVFAVNYEGEMVIKRLMRDGGQWWLASDNQDQRRYPRKICDEHSVLIGEIVHKQSERI